MVPPPIGGVTCWAVIGMKMGTIDCHSGADPSMTGSEETRHAPIVWVCAMAGFASVNPINTPTNTPPPPPPPRGGAGPGTAAPAGGGAGGEGLFPPLDRESSGRRGVLLDPKRD